MWALMGMGLRCVIARSFGDIFYSNCLQNGLLPIRLLSTEVERIAEATRNGAELNVDLTMQKVRTVEALQCLLKSIRCVVPHYYKGSMRSG